jgi:endonuclease/exonuclease/phosphatase family metal-dependent hydrolase
VELQVHSRPVHVIVVHLGLIKASRVRQLEQLKRYIAREVPNDVATIVAGDFNDWGTLVQKSLSGMGMVTMEKVARPTFPSRLPIAQLDHIYVRGLKPVASQVPRGRIWSRMSDHLPLIAEFELDV